MFQRRAFFLSFFLVITISAWGQRQVTRDQQGLAVIASLRQAMGGQLLTSVQDTVATADVTTIQDGSPLVSRVTIRTLGPDRVRIEANTAQGSSVFVMDGARAGATTSATSEEQKYPRRSFGEIAVPHLPLFSVLSDTADATVRVEYVGLEKTDDGEFHRVRLQRSLKTEDGLGDADAPIEIYVDPRTMLPARIVYALRPPANLRSTVPIELRFSDYRSFGGLVVPFRVTQLIRNQPVSDYTFLSFAINQGARRADFEVKP